MVSSVNSFNGEGSKKRPNPAVDDNPQKKIKIEHIKVSFLNSLSNYALTYSSFFLDI